MIEVPHFRQEKAKTCVPASVRMVLAHFNLKRSEQQVAKALGSTALGTNVMNIELLPKEWGLEVQTGDISVEALKDWLDKEIPVITVIETPALPYRDPNQRRRHTLVVVGYDDESVYVNDALLASAPTPVPWKNFLTAWADFGNFAAVIQKQSG
jgi:ABC-type bacteriocin/lantibiotic exporter with double-glycine peptidase domain